ncbi:hypothetical protein ACEQ8H_005694 [Pleosporales sp. CAS-2024a]
MSQLDVIPTVLEPMGPMWQHLPHDIVMQILALSILLERVYDKPGRKIDYAWFHVLTNLERFKRYRQWCKPQPMVMMKAFYLAHDFVFEYGCEFSARSYAPRFPPIRCRPFLRRISVFLCLEDCYWTLRPGHDRLTPVPATSVDEFMRCSPGARALRSLTDANTGFCNLDELELRIRTNFHMGGGEAARKLVKDANFTVCARKVTIDIVRPDQSLCLRKVCYMPCLKDLITVRLLP